MNVITLFTVALLIFADCSKFKSSSSLERQEIDSLLYLAQKHSTLIDTENSLKYAFEALELAQSANYRKGIAESYFYISQAQFNKGNYDMSMQYVIYGEEYADGNPKLASEFVRIKARIYSCLKLQDKAKEEFLKGLKGAYLNLYEKLSNTYLSLKDTTTAQEYDNMRYILEKELNDSILDSAKKILTILINKESQLKHEQRKRYYIFSVIIFILLIAIVSMWISTRRIKNKILKKKEEEIEVLKVKVNESFTKVIELAKKNDSTFMTRFEEIYPDFFNTLKRHYPKLLLSELHLLALISLQFTTKEIADFTSRSCRTIQNRKYRLRKKLGIDSEVDIIFWLKEFCQKVTKM